MPPVCLHATSFRNWKYIIGDDEQTNGLIPGGLEPKQKGNSQPPRREVHAASVPPGMSGTTINNHIPDYDVIIDIDIKRYLRAGGLAYRSQNGVILFPQKVPKEYITEAFDRRRERALIHKRPRSSTQRSLSAGRSSREDEGLFRCPRCGSAQVDQDQGPYSWPGTIPCAQCNSELAQERLKSKSLKLERTRGMADTEQGEQHIRHTTDHAADDVHTECFLEH